MIRRGSSALVGSSSNSNAGCIASARAGNAAVALISVPRFGVSGIVDAPLYAEVGKALNVPVLDSGLASLLARHEMRADPVHLNAAGYREMATTLVEALHRHGWLRR